MIHNCEICHRNICDCGRLRPIRRNYKPIKIYVCKDCFVGIKYVVNTARRNVVPEMLRQKELENML